MRKLRLTLLPLCLLAAGLSGCNPFNDDDGPTHPQGELVLLSLEPIAGSANAAEVGLRHPDGRVAAGAWEMERSVHVGQWTSIGAREDRDAIAFPLVIPAGGGPPTPTTYAVRGHRKGVTTREAAIVVPF